MRFEEYVAGLPAGLDSYPECVCKGAVVHAFRDSFRRRHPQHAFDAQLAAVGDTPVNAWVSEVRATAYYLAMRAHMPSDEAFVSFCYESNRDLLRSPLFRALFTFLSVARVVAGGAERWERFHKGVTLATAIGKNSKSATLTLQYPRNLVPLVMARGYATAFVAAAEAAGGGPARFDVVEHTPLGAQFQGTWT